MNQAVRITGDSGFQMAFQWLKESDKLKAKRNWSKQLLFERIRNHLNRKTANQ